MADTKVCCPKCKGHIVFPNELAGEPIPCPHCNETFFLPSTKSSAPWIFTTVFALIAICLGAMLLFKHKKGSEEPQIHSFAKSGSQVDDSAVVQAETPITKSADDHAIEKICKRYYDGLSSQDIKSVYELLPESCKKDLTISDISIDDAKYDFLSLESVQYHDGTFGKCALAKVKRRVQTNFAGTRDGLRDLQFVQEADGWKLFPKDDLAKKIVAEFARSGFTDQTSRGIQLLRGCDVFVAWDNNNTNAFEAVFKFDQRRAGVFPWNLEFAVISNRVDGMMLVLDYSIRNKSPTQWPSPLLEFNLKRSGKVVLSGNDLLPTLNGGQELQRSTTFFLAGEPQQTSEYDLDVSYPDGIQNNINLAHNIALEFKVRPISELAKLEVLSTQFDLAKSVDFQDMYSARINFRVKNTGSEPIQSLDVKCVWYFLNGEQLNQSTEYVVGFGDVPLGVGQFKTGFIRCGTGYRNARVPVKVDVFLESGEKRSLTIKGLLIK